MRIGIVAHWFNRGQGVVARHLRSALDELGHDTFVLARPTRATNRRPAFVDRGDVWDQPEVTEASTFAIPAAEYEQWAAGRRLDAVFFDQNYQFEEIAGLRRRGVTTLARFVWEAFSPADVAGAREAFDVIYSVTECEQRRYAELGIDSPRVVWGCHPELLAVRPEREEPPVKLFFPGGFLSKRKPIRPVLRAFADVPDADLRLVVKAQVPRRGDFLQEMSDRDPRIAVIRDDLPAAEHLRLFASCHVCLAPSRWEGLGLHLYEAVAFGMPIVTTDIPPMNEVVRAGFNGLLLAPRPTKHMTRSGIPAYDPDRNQLVDAIRRLADPELRAQLSAGALETRERLSWSRTVAGLRTLLETAVPVAAAGRP
ncbi:MAG TPA: glycosyltransferase family 4 protein [Solirubrobacteraceae bacterium]|nr:glycosyltransferase family 4 protein [Solirubrobacteraceae bacterium]